MGKKIILVVEDELDAAKILVKRLTNEGFEVSVATDAYQGTSAIFKEKIDLVILDLMLPGGGGLSVLRNIRSSPKIMNMPVVVISGMSDEVDKENISREGIAAYLIKPYDFQELYAIIQNILSHKKA